MAGWVTSGYPGGSVQVETGDEFPWKQAPCKLVLHSTETAGFPDYPANKAPHVTVHPRARQWRQHRVLDKPAWALKAGAVSTNSMGAIQIEIVAYAASLKDMSGGDLDYLTGFIRFIGLQAGIPLQCTVLFGGSETAGVGGARRMSAAQWTAYRGICGHQHVPINEHWDPGDIPMQAVWLPKIRGVASKPNEVTPEPEDEDEKMIVLAQQVTNAGDKYDPTKPVWIGDGITRRLAQDAQTVADVIYKINTGFWKGNPVVQMADRLDWLGTPVPFEVKVDTSGLTVNAAVTAADKQDIATLTVNGVKTIEYDTKAK